LQRGANQQLIEPVAGQSIQPGQHGRCLHPGGPDHQFRRNARPLAVCIGIDGADPFAGQHLHLQILQLTVGPGGHGRRQCRQDAWPGLDQGQPDVAVRIDVFPAMCHQFARGVAQFGRQFHPGGTGADDGELQLPGAQRP
jgi:hypothetical protein